MSRPPTPPPSRRQRRAQARGGYVPQARTPGAAGKGWRSPIVLASVGAVALAAVLVILAGAFDVFGSKEFRTPPTVYSAALTDGETMGSPDAPVTIEIWSDFQCPACKAFITSQLANLVAQFVIPGEVRLVGKDIDIIDRNKVGESLELGAGAACAAQQDKYWQFHDYVFWNQGRENKGDHARAFIDKVATAAGLDMNAFAACFATDAVRTAIVERTQLAFANGIDSTPTLVINGEAIKGVPDYNQLATKIQGLIDAASPAPGGSVAPSQAPSAAPSAS